MLFDMQIAQIKTKQCSFQSLRTAQLQTYIEYLNISKNMSSLMSSLQPIVEKKVESCTINL